MKLLCLILLSTLSSVSLAATVGEAMAEPGRLQADIERDARSRPDAVIPLLELEAGDRVADVFAGGGYYSELLARVVGDEGEVLLQNNRAYKAFVGDALTERFDGRDPGSITVLDSEAADLQLGKSSLNAAVIIMSYHDLFYDDADNGWPQIDDANFIGQIYRALKPGGRFLIVDHAARAGTAAGDAQSLHRIEEAFAIKRLSAQGFRLVGSSDALRNPADDHSLLVFDPAIRGRTDRFVLVFERP
jgi:predicted methyltransferase